MTFLLFVKQWIISPLVKCYHFFFLTIFLSLLFSYFAAAQTASIATTERTNADSSYSMQSATIAQTREQLLRSLPAGVNLTYLDQLASLYAANHQQPLWHNQQALNEFKEQLTEVTLSGVSSQFSGWLKQLSNPDLTGTGRDVVYSDALLGYLFYVEQFPLPGKNALYNNNSMPIKVPSEQMLNKLKQALANQQLLTFVRFLAPQHPQYKEMRTTFVTLLENDKPWKPLTRNITLRPGQRSSDVPLIRDMLIHYGLMTPRLPNLTAATNEQSKEEISRQNELYSTDMVAAVKAFQQKKGLKADGIIGANTLHWLNVSPGLRIPLLALNMQRLRLLPAHPQNAIMVNIPEYALDYYKNGKLALESKVVVGRPDRKTPMMYSTLSRVATNPPWNVPNTILTQDLIPKEQRNPGYLRRNGYTVLSGWQSNAKEINPATVNWKALSGRRSPYRIRQAPGPENALGRYKFDMPSSDAIYLHDTPARGLFAKELRALSSGCVRVHKAGILANMLLGEAGWSNERIERTLRSMRTTHIPIKRSILVDLYYLTAWVDQQNVAQFRTDIYGYDKKAFPMTDLLPMAQHFLTQSAR